MNGGDYVRAIRARVGRSRIFYPWAGLALRDAAGRLFLVRAASGHLWHCPGGGLEIGERPADAASRELEEETGLHATTDGLVGCWSGPQMAYGNGDRIQAIGMLLRGRRRGGVEQADRTGEIDARGWFSPEELPRLSPPWDERVRLVLSGEGRSFN